MAMSSYQLPDEITEEVFSLLSVKDLLRFRCVSKSWSAIIDKDAFVKKHLQRSITESESNDNPTLLTRTKHQISGLVTDMYKVQLLDDDVPSQYNRVEFELPPFLRSKNNNLRVVGACNGIVCLSSTSSIVIWNPLTREAHELPTMSLTVPPGEFYKKITSIYGFGHDLISDDYKVIGILCIYNNVEINVYSLKTKSWTRRISSGDFPNPLGVLRHGSFARTTNSIYWVFDFKERIPNRYLIAGFDLGVDIGYHEVQHPDYNSEFISSIYLGVLRGNLCLFTSYSSSSHIWELMKNEKKWSWVKKFSFFKDVPIWNTIKRPLVFSQNCEKALLYDHRYRNATWYDPKNKSYLKAVMLPRSDIVEEVWVESLVRVI